ncbi:MAG TPA: DUF4013 domain-containing protein [Methanocorpusculum sp.]|nr:DUF4013 domain-containing protein [Methanocorpusculum sp.]
MSIGIGDNLTGSFGFAKDKLGRNFGTWLILAILNLLPIVNWIVYGTYVRVLRGGDPKLENIGKLFVDGLLAYIISILYLLIPMIFALSLGFFFGYDTSAGPLSIFTGLTPLGIVLIIVCIAVFFLFLLLLIPALVNFADRGFGAAFRYSEIFGMISKAGWLKYILSFIIIDIIFGIICLIGLVPYYIGIIILIILVPYLKVWGTKYFRNLFM